MYISKQKGRTDLNKLVKVAAMAGGAFLLAQGLDKRLEVTNYIVQSDKIPPSFDGYKIAQISDYHNDTVPGVSDAVRDIKPDLIVSTGDLADDEGDYLSALHLCERIANIAPVYAVTGNHDLWRGDYSDFERDIKNAGVTTLHNERVILEADGEGISLSGIDDPFTLNSARAREAVRNNLSKIRGYDGYDILLFHRANLFDCIKDQGFDLVLAGHMHGGQIRFPSGRGFVSPKSGWTGKHSVFFPKYSGGRYSADGSEMLVSRGLGNPMLIPRFFNRPELTVVTLKHI